MTDQEDNGMTYLERFGLTDSSIMALSPYLQGLRLDDEDSLDLARGLADNWSLTSLEMARCNVTPDGALALASALEVNSTLRYLGLARNRVQDAGAVQLATALAVNQSIEILDLSGNGIRDSGALALAQMLEQQPETRLSKRAGELRTLLLANNRIGKAGAAAIGAALSQVSRLKMLNISRNRLMEAGAIALAKGLAENQSLTQLNLGHNDINPEGCQAISDAMIKNSSITVLHIHANRVGRSAVHFAKMLNENKSLRDLSLENCFIDAEDAKGFAYELRDPSLLSINFGLNPLGDEGVAQVCRAFRGKPIRYFDLSEVSLSARGMQPVCDFVNIAPCLQTLQLDGNILQADSLKELCRVLSTNTTVDSLNLERTGLGSRGANILADALRNNCSMRSLNVADNNIGDEGCVALSKVLARFRRVGEFDVGSNGITGAPGVINVLCSVFTYNTALHNIKLEDNPAGERFPGGMFTREHAMQICQDVLPEVDPVPLQRDETRSRGFASPLTSLPREPASDDALQVRGTARPGAAGLMNAAETLFRPAWAPAVPPHKVYGDEKVRSIDDEDEDEAEDGANPPLIPAKGSLMHPLYPGYGKGRMSNEAHCDTLEGCLPLPLAHSSGRSVPDTVVSAALQPGFAFLNPVRRAAKRSPYSLDSLESNVGSLPVTEEMLRRKFQELDVDGSGSLDYSEFKVIFSNFQNFGVYQAEAEVDQIMKKYKVMDDGRISFDEFCLIMLALARR